MRSVLIETERISRILHHVFVWSPELRLVAALADALRTVQWLEVLSEVAEARLSSGGERPDNFSILSEAGEAPRLCQRRFLRPRRYFSAFEFSRKSWFVDQFRRSWYWTSGKATDFANLRQILTDFCRNCKEFEQFSRKWCQDCYVTEKSEKTRRNSQNFVAELLKFCQKKCML